MTGPRLRKKIEEEPWDEWLIENDRYLFWGCVAVIVAAVAYFGGHLLIWKFF